MTDLPADIHVTWAPTEQQLGARLASHLPTSPSPLPLTGPGSDHRNTLTGSLRRAWRAEGFATTVLQPRPELASLAGRGGWTAITVDGARYRIDSRLVTGAHVALVPITRKTRRGPFVLDQPVAFLHPVDRLRLAARPSWRRHVADLSAGARPALAVLVTAVGGGWLGLVTADPIAAELWALAFAERWLGDGVEMQGPWEEPAVQRATELQLGARIPADLRLHGVDDPTLTPVAHQLLRECSTRLGMSTRPR